MDPAILKKIVKGVLGSSHDNVIDVLERGVRKGYERKRYFEKLTHYIDDASAMKIVDKVFLETGVAEVEVSRKRRKFVEEPSDTDTRSSREKKLKTGLETSGDNDNGYHAAADHPSPPKTPEGPALPPSDGDGAPVVQTPAATPLNPTKIQDVMLAAKKAIEERKKQMNMTGVGSLKPGEASQYMQEALEKQRKMEELKARIAAKLPGILDGPASRLLSNTTGAGAGSGGVRLGAAAAAAQKGEVGLPSSAASSSASSVPVTLTHRIPTLKANQRTITEQLKHRGGGASIDIGAVVSADSADVLLSDIVKEGGAVKEEEDLPKHFDNRITVKGPSRKPRMLSFHKKGEFETLANRMRAKARLEMLQHEISSVSKKTGILSAAKLALVAPSVGQSQLVPDVEWWDEIVLGEGNDYSTPLASLDLTPVSQLIEHPIQLAPPGYQPDTELVGIRTHLTQRERKKLRRQNRKEMQRELNEKVRLGLEPPPEPKVKISNLMRVLGTEAVQDPTKMEAHVREQMAKRQKKHEEANLARKLTPGQRKEKNKRKLFEDVSQGVNVTVYRISDLSHPAKKFKIETNARQLYMTGTVVLHPNVNVIVLEGGPKQSNFMKRLLLGRIKWNDDMVYDSVKDESQPNKCVLVWEGVVKDRNFGEIKFKSCPLEKAAREHFALHRVEHYWDLAFSGNVLENSEDFVAY